MLCLLEELGAPYTLDLIDRGRGDNATPAFRAMNPLGKLPTLRHGDTVVTEQVAIFIYLADLFPGTHLAPALTDPQRGRYLRWLVFYAACFEPALLDRARKVEAGARAMSPYGSYDEVIDLLAAALEPGPWLLGDAFSAGRRAVGHRTELDDGVQAGAAPPRVHRLHRPRHGPPGGRQSAGKGQRTGCRTSCRGRSA